MTVTPIPKTGNSSKFTATTKHGSFVLAFSHTLKEKIWQIDSEARELEFAAQLAEAIVSRHDHAYPFRKVYVFAEHTTEPTPDLTINIIRKYGYEGAVHEKKR